MTQEELSPARQSKVASSGPGDGSAWQACFIAWLRSTSTLTKVVGAAGVAMVAASAAARAETSCSTGSAVACTTTGSESAVSETVAGPDQTSLTYTNGGTITNGVSGLASVNAFGNGTPMSEDFKTYNYLFAPSVTATNNGTITSTGSAGSGLLAVSTGAMGVADGDNDDSTSAPNNHYMGRDGGTVQVTNNGTINVQSSGSGFKIGYGGLAQPLNTGIDARSIGGAGNANSHSTSSNGPGGDAGTVNVTTTASSAINLSGSDTAGIYALSVGGQGPGYSHDATHNFDSGGNGNVLTVDHAGAITGTASGNVGIYALSVGGASGATDNQYSLHGGNGGYVGVDLAGTSSIDVTGDQSQGVFAASVGGLSWYADNANSGNHRNGNGGTVVVTIDAGATVTTSGELGVGIVAASTGGNANTTLAPPDSLENNGSPNSVPTTRAPAGIAGSVTVTHDGAVSTSGDVAIGIAAVSSTGGRVVGLLSGSGATIDPVGTGSGAPGIVTVNGSGSIETQGAGAMGILALSLGGPGGVLDTKNGILNLLGGDDSVNNGINGNGVSVATTGRIQTSGAAAIGILASSVGGGGGSASGTKGIIAVGSNGGGGGNGGPVTVSAAGGGLATGGDGAIGVLAQSVGGGGGNGGSASGLAAAAGSAGAGGSGGKVSVDLNGGSLANLTTAGDFAAGVIAQSIGGGGGNGGYAKGFGTIASLAIGGAGGSGSSGGEVDMTNHGATVSTSGAHSTGLIAQSVGGGGGNGGSANTYTANLGFSIALAIGGKSGAGGDGGTIGLVNNYHIQTTAEDALGMIAQSIGGGGGNGGAATAKSLVLGTDDPEVPSVVVDMSVGGAGGSGGDGGSVTVSNSGQTITHGDSAHALLAQSVGGGGGNGGDSTSMAAAIEGESETLKVSVALGAKGGSGGSGGSVEVTNGSSDSCGGCKSETQTYGNDAAGIVAQSIGGGGGNSTAGNASTDSPNLGDKTGDALNFSFSLGAQAGTGGTGGQVTVGLDSANPVTTSGSGAIGILAQSIGGGGGNVGGGSSGGSGDKINLNVSVGGDGGSGNTGGNVTVTSQGSISTSGGDSVGIVAQSIGGGGGVAGSADGAATISDIAQVEDVLNAPSNAYSANVGVGGNGGTGANGGQVTVTNDGTIGTKGSLAYGILAQSIGGGGGSGGAATSGANSVVGGPSPGDDGNQTGKTYAASVSVGGKGAAAGNGGSVTVSTSQAITTLGYGAHGILAHSIGGGGGVGAEGTVNNTTTLGLGAGVAGDGGAAGNGGGVEVDQSATTTTVGDDAYGILAQSIGGGGGTAGLGCSNSIKGAGQTGLEATACFGNVGASDSASIFNDSSDFTLKVGGTSGASGNGGAVTIEQDSGAIVTFGARSIGLAAQSIGGGGGLVTASAANIGASQLQFQAGQNYAKGGDVSVSLGDSASITTHGDGAWGILAQSIGGGGGFVADPSLALQFPVSNTLPDKPNSSDHYPDSGQVTVNVGGNIITSGTNAHGIFAQAIGGGGGIAGGVNRSRSATLVAGNSAQLYDLGSPTYAGEAMEVTVNQTGGTIQTSGAGSIGIVAQASGKNNYQRPITVTVGGKVIGGTGTGSAGILVSGGGSSDTDSTRMANTITVNAGGSISTMDGTSGTAITTGSGLTNLVNNGTITGSIQLGSGTVSGNGNALAPATAMKAPAATSSVGPMASGRIDNRGTLVTGSSITARTLTNSGMIEVDGAGGTRLDGDLVQTDRGQLTIDTDHVAGKADLLTITGDAKLAGRLAIRPSMLIPSTVTVLSAGGALELGRGFAAIDSHVFRFMPSVAADNRSLRVTPNADFHAGDEALDGAQQSLASHLQRIWDSEAPDTFASGFAQLANEPRLSDSAGYSQVLDQLSGEALGAIGASRHLASQQFVDAMSSCPAFEGDASYQRERDCGWFRTVGGGVDRSSSGDQLGFVDRSVTLQAGGQKEIADGWFVGGSLAYQNSSLSAKQGAGSARGDVAMAGLLLKRQTGNWILSGALDGGYGWYDTKRSLDLGGVQQTASASPDTQQVGLHSRIAYQFPFTGWYLKPYVDLDAVYLRTGGFTESGASAFDLEVDAEDDLRFAAAPMLEVGGRVPLGEGVLLRPFASLGGVFYDDNDWSLRARFVDAPPGTGGFTSNTDLPEALAQANLGLEFTASDRLQFRLEYQGQLGEDYQGHAGSVRINWLF